MRESWFLAPERCADRGAVMRVKGHERCRCKSCRGGWPTTELDIALRQQQIGGAR